MLQFDETSRELSTIVPNSPKIMLVGAYCYTNNCILYVNNENIFFCIFNRNLFGKKWIATGRKLMIDSHMPVYTIHVQFTMKSNIPG